MLYLPLQKQLLWTYMSYKKIKELELCEAGKIGYTYKSMGSGFWALKQDNFRKAIEKIVMQVIHLNIYNLESMNLLRRYS